MNWTTFKAGVQDAYSQGANTTEIGYAAVAAYVKALIVREVDSDLPLSKSFMNTYDKLKSQMAGTTVAVFATTKPEVLTRITVDANRAAISTYIDAAIAEAIADINKMAVTWERYLVEFALDLQRHVPCFTQNQFQQYLKAGVTSSGFVSKIIPPAGNVTKVTMEHYAPDLAVSAYSAGDKVTSNGRMYEVVTAGAVSTIAVGLVTTDGSDETLGTAVFKFTSSPETVELSPVMWKNRFALSNGEVCQGAYYTINQQNTDMWIFPILDSTSYKFLVYWNGIKKTFAGNDNVTFDETCFVPAAEFVRSMVQKNLMSEDRAASFSYANYQVMLRKLWLDCQQKFNSAQYWLYL